MVCTSSFRELPLANNLCAKTLQLNCLPHRKYAPSKCWCPWATGSTNPSGPNLKCKPVSDDWHTVSIRAISRRCPARQMADELDFASDEEEAHRSQGEEPEAENSPEGSLPQLNASLTAAAVATIMLAAPRASNSCMKPHFSILFRMMLCGLPLSSIDPLRGGNRKLESWLK